MKVSLINLHRFKERETTSLSDFTLVSSFTLQVALSGKSVIIGLFDYWAVLMDLNCLSQNYQIICVQPESWKKVISLFPWLCQFILVNLNVKPKD